MESDLKFSIIIVFGARNVGWLKAIEQSLVTHMQNVSNENV